MTNVLVVPYKKQMRWRTVRSVSSLEQKHIFNLARLSIPRQRKDPLQILSTASGAKGGITEGDSIFCNYFPGGLQY